MLRQCNQNSLPGPALPPFSGKGLPVAFLWLLLSLLFFTNPLQARNRYYEALQRQKDRDHPYLEELLKKAREKHLWQNRIWLLLGHYRGNESQSLISEADDDDFFLSENGKTDPAGELEATLRAYFVPVDAIKDDAAPEKLKIDQNYHPRCNFPARYLWLDRELNIDESRLPAPRCEKFNELYRKVRAKTVSLVFASYYASDPASMFGHTLLRLTPEDPELAESAINFAANTAGYDMIRYVLYGLFGGFDGYFSYVPYDRKVREYNFRQNRDIWEYELNLTPEEIRFIQLHIWELKTTGFAYFYMTENCSYRLLTLLELVRPELYLQKKFPAWVVPGETIRAITEIPDLVRTVRYFPSFRNRIDQYASTLDDQKKELFEKLSSGDYSKTDDLDEDPRVDPEMAEKVRMVRIYHDQKRLEIERPGLPDRVREKDLSNLDHYLIQEESPPEGVEPVENGHELLAMGGAFGMRGSSPFFEYRIRPVMHGMENASQGYSPHTSLAYVDARLRYYPTDDLWMIHRVDIVKVLSLGGGDFLGTRPGFLVDIYALGIYNRGFEPDSSDRNILSYSLLNRFGTETALLPYTDLLESPGMENWISTSLKLDSLDVVAGPANLLDLYTARWRDLYLQDLEDRSQKLRGYPVFRIDALPAVSLFAGHPGGTELVVTGFGGLRFQADPVDAAGTGVFPAAGLQILFRTGEVRVLGKATVNGSRERPDPEASLALSWSLSRNFEFLVEGGTDSKENEASLQFLAHF